MSNERESLYIKYNDLGEDAYSQEDYQNALSFWQNAVENSDDQLKTSEINEKIVDVLDKLGDERFEQGDFSVAIDYYKSILTYNTRDWSLYFKVGERLKQLGEYNQALHFFEKVISISPEHSYSYLLMGYIYYQNMEDFVNALDCFKKYVEIEPQDPQAYIIIGHLYKRIDYHGSAEKQIEYFEKALELMPGLKDVIKNLAYAYSAMERCQEAAECFEQSFSPETSADDYFVYSCMKMKLGDFDEGWKYYESRFTKESDKTHYPVTEKPKWEGQTILDKTLLVQYEQGFGDSLQFFRYLEKAKPFVKKIIFRAQDELADLFRINANGIEILSGATPLDELPFDYHVPLMDLVRLMDPHLDTVPVSEGYIKADESKIEKYKKEFFDNDCLKIGISWHGAACGNVLRNISLDTFYPLTKIKNVKIYSFQKGIGSEQLEQLPEGVEIVDLGKTFEDFSDTAAAMANLDLFISSDNGVFNLAGAMGKKSFLLLNKPSNWRWFFDEETTRWYENVKVLKKQFTNESWNSLLQRVIEILR